jgi:hypothetical protein
LIRGVLGLKRPPAACGGQIVQSVVGSRGGQIVQSVVGSRGGQIVQSVVGSRGGQMFSQLKNPATAADTAEATQLNSYNRNAGTATTRRDIRRYRRRAASRSYRRRQR